MIKIYICKLQYKFENLLCQDVGHGKKDDSVELVPGIWYLDGGGVCQAKRLRHGPNPYSGVIVQYAEGYKNST